MTNRVGVGLLTSLLVVGVTTSLVSVAAAQGPTGLTPDGNSAPLADAGLDQQVQYGSTVRLDASGSRDPDGAITAYEWTIERPNGTTVEPDCPSCGQTAFRPQSAGTYEVTVTVTDDDGAIRSDTLYVDVEDGAGPSVSLSGPRDPLIATDQVYAARIDAGDHAIERLTWIVGGETVSRTPATAGNESRTLRFGDTTESFVKVRVTDAADQTAVANRTVNPRLNRGVRGAAAEDDDTVRIGTYIPSKDVWLREDAIDTEAEAIAFAREGSQALDDSEKGGVLDNLDTRDEEDEDETDSPELVKDGRDSNTGIDSVIKKTKELVS